MSRWVLVAIADLRALNSQKDLYEEVNAIAEEAAPPGTNKADVGDEEDDSDYFGESFIRSVVSGTGSVPKANSRLVLNNSLNKVLQSQSVAAPPIHPDVFYFGQRYDRLSSAFHNAQKSTFDAKIRSQVEGFPLSLRSLDLAPYSEALREKIVKSAQEMRDLLDESREPKTDASMTTKLWHSLICASMANDIAHFWTELGESTDYYGIAANYYRNALEHMRIIEAPRQNSIHRIRLRGLRFRATAGILDTAPWDTTAPGTSEAKLTTAWKSYAFSEGRLITFPKSAALSTTTLRKFIGASCVAKDDRAWDPLFESLVGFAPQFSLNKEGLDHRPKNWPYGTLAMSKDDKFRDFCAYITSLNDHRQR